MIDLDQVRIGTKGYRMTTLRTEYEIVGTLQGGLWWPIGEPAQKNVRMHFVRPGTPHDPWTGEAESLASMLSAVDSHEGGAFSDCARMTADSLLIITRHGPNGRRRQRAYELARFPSVAGYVNPDAWSWIEEL